MAGREQPESTLYKWKRSSKPKSKDAIPFSVGYHGKQNDVKKWIKSVDAAADQALQRHLRTEQEHLPTTGSSHSADVAHNVPIADGDRKEVIGTSDAADVVAEANQLLSSYMASSGDPLSEVNLSAQYAWAQGHYASSHAMEAHPSLDPLGEAQFALETLGGVASLEIPQHSSTLDAFIPLDEQVKAELGSVVNHLLAAPIAHIQTPRATDPQIKMEARYMQVHERTHKRRVKEAKKKEAERISSEAKVLVAEQKAEDDAKKEMEDMLLQVEVKKVRKKVRKEKEAIERAIKDISAAEGGRHVPRGMELKLGQTASARSDSCPGVALADWHTKPKRPTDVASDSVLPRTDVLLAKRRATRQILEVQLKEAEEQEARDRLKLLGDIVAGWHSLALARQLQYNRALAVIKWRQVFRCWTRWRGALRTRQIEKEEEEATQLELQLKRLELAATKLNRKFLLRRCMWAWKRYAKQASVLGSAETDMSSSSRINDDVTRQRMDGLLQAITSGILASKFEKLEEEKMRIKAKENREYHGVARRELDREVTRPGPNSHSSGDKADIRSSVKRGAQNLITSHTAAKHLEQVARSTTSAPSKVKISSAGVKFSSNGETSARPVASSVGAVDIVQNVDDVRETKLVSDLGNLSKTSAKTPHTCTGQHTSTYTDTGHAASRQKSATLVPSSKELVLRERQADVSDIPLEQQKNGPTVHAPLRKQSTLAKAKPREAPHCDQREVRKSALLTAMEERAAAIAARKQQRQQRQKETEDKRLADLRRIDEENKAAREAEKQAAVQKRREERAKAKESERLKEEAARQQQLLENKVERHYHKSLVKFYGMHPWKTFMENIQEQERLAEHVHSTAVKRSSFGRWLHQWTEREEQRLQMAEDLKRFQLLRFYFHAWLKEVFRSRATYQLAVKQDNSRLLRHHFLSWMHYCRQVKRQHWEKERRALVHNNKRLKKVYLRQWRAYIPHHRQQVEQEKRRQLLRSRVSQWLPDYTATSCQAE